MRILMLIQAAFAGVGLAFMATLLSASENVAILDVITWVELSAAVVLVVGTVVLAAMLGRRRAWLRRAAVVVESIWLLSQVRSFLRDGSSGDVISLALCLTILFVLLSRPAGKWFRARDTR
ncbi:hypothetical protein [Nonomuraea typhae]|uniref:hypothetical protein n=1 Tax=Nonomuraea typhae TaxID=2603600 RepID=UPI0012FADF01|nr:hypothetical protein [Nonomuraea typhae]